MKTVTKNQIKERLTNSFNDVKPLAEINAEAPKNAAHTHTVTVINFLGLQLFCGCYSLTDDTENGDYQRFVYIPETKQAFKF